MGRPARKLLSAALCVAAALAASSCGGSDAQLLPGSTAREITANLEVVQQLADEGDCIGAESAAQQVSEQIAELEGVDARLKQALQEGAARLNEVVADCAEPTTEETSPSREPQEEETTEGNAAKEKGGQNGRGKDRSKKEEATPTTPETTPSKPSPAPQSEGEGNEPETGSNPPGAGEGDEEGSSGGVSPGTALGGEGQ